MRTANVFTHFRCNQRCGYCTYRRAEDDRAFIVRAAVEARIARAIDAGAQEIALSGGEPTMRDDLERLVAFAKARGPVRVVLETNATLVDAARAARLRDAGLDGVRVNLVGFGPQVDAITQDEGGFAATLRGMHAFVDAGVPLTVRSALVRSSLGTVPDLPAAVAEAFAGRIDGWLLVVPTESPDPAELLPYELAAPSIVAFAEAARVAGIPVKFASESPPPPCVFPELGRVAHLFSLTPGGRERGGHVPMPACSTCAVRDRCAGVSEAYVARHGLPRAEPVRDDRMRRRLSLIATVEEQIARELLTRDTYSTSAGVVVEEDLIRVNFHCNQSCRFCFVSTHLPAAATERIRAAIVASGQAGRRITISGGEPTLNPDLVEFVRLAKASSPHPIRLQTNAIRLASAQLADAVVQAGVSEAFVSLHGSSTAIGDAVTHAPGTYEKTVLGIDNLVARGVAVVLNFVICETNMTDLAAYVELVADRWPSASVNVSFVAPSTDVVPREREFIPRYADAMPHLARAIEVARRRGVEVVGFESMCGIPLCLVPDSVDAYFGLAEVPPGYDRGEFVYADACASCDLRGRCYGMRRGYAELHGTGELNPIRRVSA